MTKQKVALITGAQRGIGRAIALKAASLGFAVAVNYHEEEADALALVEQIVTSGGAALPVQADLGSVPSIETMVRPSMPSMAGLMPW